MIARVAKRGQNLGAVRHDFREVPPFSPLCAIVEGLRQHHTCVTAYIEYDPPANADVLLGQESLNLLPAQSDVPFAGGGHAGNLLVKVAAATEQVFTTKMYRVSRVVQDVMKIGIVFRNEEILKVDI